MATITTRADNGSPLTNTQVDANFTNLNDDKQEILAEGAFVDGDKTKLDGIESGATADQTAGEIKTAYESNADTNAFTDAEQTKLSGIEASADVTDTANVTAAGALMDSELTDIAAVKALNQGVSTTDEPTFENTLLSAIDTSIADTAVDVFIYDTRKDSDGGAWRKRTQNTSWYNETLNTSTRGSRREFPAVAVIVAESNQVTIYDGDDPDMPMWMIFETGRTPTVRMLNWYTGSTAVVLCVSQLNGRLCVGTTGGVTQFDFAEDATYLSYHLSTAYTPINNRISFRNDSNASNSGSSSEYFYFIVNPTINDVAMTVLPNAPIDSATGLPIPTIAVATNGGVSVIKDDGTVVDITATNVPVIYDIAFTSDYKVLFRTSDTSGEDNYIHVFEHEMLSSDINYSYYYAMGESTGIDYSYIDDLSLNNAVDGRALATKDEEFTLGTVQNGAVKVYRGSTNLNESMTAHITSSYNTGWMNGDIKLATLSDTDDTDVTGTELVTNGTFDTDLTGWTDNSTGGFSVSGGQLVKVNNGGDSINQVITTEAGKTYVMTLDVISYTSGSLQMYWNGDFGDSFGDAANVGTTISKTVTATSATTQIRLYGNSGSIWTVDNFSVRLAEEDRSVNNNGLQVFGTVTKNPVATGADLVAYSGFSASNYLEQPYNSDLDFGTGDFCKMGWVYNTSHSTRQAIFRRNIGSGDDGRDLLTIETSGDLKYGIANSIPSVTASSSLNVWHHVAVIRKGGVISMYVDGILKDSTADARTVTSSTGQAVLWFGVIEGNNLPLTNGSLALWRISATAPSDEQIKKIYEDEKFLFQENAEATLYGSSDAVTALAYDDSTDLLHAGTSAGRSVFQGLRRVDNTTDAVGSAISASNGMVADD